MSQEHSVLLRVKGYIIPKELLFSVMEEFDMVTYEKKRQYQEIIDEEKLLVSCYRKVPLQSCFDLLDWCARYQELKPNLFKGIQAQRKGLKEAKFGLSKKLLLKISEICELKEVEYPDCLKELLRVGQLLIKI